MRRWTASFGLVLVLVLAGFPSTAAAAPPPTPHVWVHYDYLVYPDGHSDLPDPSAIQRVVDVYAAHGIVLEIDSHHAGVPVSNPNLILDSEGPSPCDAVSHFAIKAQYFHPTSNHEWHYALFGDKLTSANGDCSTGASGWAVLNGDDFDVSMTVARRQGASASQAEAVFFMHELGHNLGLRHGGNEDTNYKPNYLSVMNYAFGFVGISYAAAPGGTTFAGSRLDYSESALPSLDLLHLNETVGIQAGTNDITHYYSGYSSDPGSWIPGSGPATGPIDWDLDGSAAATDVAVNLVSLGCCFLPRIVTGFDDWAEVRGFILGTIRHGPKTIAREDAAEQPVVTGISPAGGPAAGATTVTITGSHLGKATRVLFGGVDATSYKIISQQTIVAVSPPAAAALAGPVDVTVVSGMSPSPSVAADQFTYAPWQQPTVIAISPTAGPGAGNTTVTITGTNLAGATGVAFDLGTSRPASSFTVVDDHTIRAVSPAWTTILYAGTWVDVTVTTPGGTSPRSTADRFSYVAVPTVIGVSPGVGFDSGDTTVTIQVTDNEFYAGITGVTFGSTAAESFTQPVISFPNYTLTAVSPPGVGSVDVHITDAGGISAPASGDTFMYVPKPVISSFTPSMGPPGTVVTITGQHLGSTTGVLFGAGSSASFTVVDDSTLLVTAPFLSATGGGATPIFLVTDAGVVSSATNFTYP